MLSKTKEQIALGVLIPTRNREEYLVHSIESALKFRLACPFGVKIFIANNGDEQLSQSLTEALERDGITLIERPLAPISMSQNWHRGYQCVKEEIVTHLLIMGDDDLLLNPDYRPFTKAFLDGYDAVICNRSARRYLWETPDSPARIQFTRENSKQMVNRMRSNPEDLFISPSLYAHSPSPYQGFVSMEWLGKVVQEFGVLSPARSPDVFLSFALASMTQFSSVSLRRPFLADGQSPKSNGASMLGFSKNTQPAQDFGRLSASEISETTTLPGLESFPSLFVATTEVYDWVKLKRPNLRDLDLGAVVHGMALDLRKASSSDAEKLRGFAAAIGRPFAAAEQNDDTSEPPSFELRRKRFTAEARELTPAQVCTIMSSSSALMKYLWSTRSAFARSFPANMRKLAGRARVKAKRS